MKRSPFLFAAGAVGRATRRCEDFAGHGGRFAGARQSCVSGLRVSLCWAAVAAGQAVAQPVPDPAPPATQPARRVVDKLPPQAGWLRVTKDYEVWIDFQKKQVIVGGEICLREGYLEMFACPAGTKEHESIVAAHTPARFVHAALVALGAKPGPAVQFEPSYKPAQGTEIRVDVLWRDEAGKEQRVKAQEWVKHVKTGQELEYPWVFAGSGFWNDEDGKEQFYYADGGEFICVSNFSTAMLDLPIESSAANDTLMFTAFTERIPARGTPLMLFLTPAPEKSSADVQGKQEADGEAKTKSGPSRANPSDQETPATPEPARPAADADKKRG